MLIPAKDDYFVKPKEVTPYDPLDPKYDSLGDIPEFLADETRWQQAQDKKATKAQAASTLLSSKFAPCPSPSSSPSSAMSSSAITAVQRQARTTDDGGAVVAIEERMEENSAPTSETSTPAANVAIDGNEQQTTTNKSQRTAADNAMEITSTLTETEVALDFTMATLDTAVQVVKNTQSVSETVETLLTTFQIVSDWASSMSDCNFLSEIDYCWDSRNMDLLCVFIVNFIQNIINKRRTLNRGL